jgi:26S proteasome regulatory subunit N6
MFSLIPKARTAKIVRNILDLISTFPNTLAIQINLCREVIEWCKSEKRTFLRQRIESKVCLLSPFFSSFHPSFNFLSLFRSPVSGVVVARQTSTRGIDNYLSFVKVATLPLLLCHPPLRELKKLDDKQMLTEVHLLESHINHSLQNIPKGYPLLFCLSPHCPLQPRPP